MRENRIVAPATLALLALAAFGCSSGLSSEDVAITNQPIANGITLSQTDVDYFGLVAIYHPDPDHIQTYYPRPCSGTILGSAGGYSTVLTARHCVTTDGNIGGPLVAANTLRLIATANPGAANPNPPFGTVTPYSLSAMPIAPSVSASASDLALIYVQADWSTHVASRFGLWVGGTDRSYPGVDYAMGYGINTADWNCHANRSIEGAGTARWGGNFIRSSFERNKNYGAWDYSLRQPDAAGQSIICGDSGGPDFVDLAFDDNTYLTHLVGVHSTGGSSSASSAGMSLWLQIMLGGTALSPIQDGHTYGLHRANNSHAVSLVQYSDTRWIYTWNNASIYDPGQEDVGQDWCLDVSNSKVVANLCNGSSKQKWYLDANMRIHNASATGSCLTATSSGAKVSTCAALPLTQGWVFHAW